MNKSRDSADPRYGAWKFIEEIELEDLIAHPVWLWCMGLGLADEDDGPIGGDETSMRPLLGKADVPQDGFGSVLILLRVCGTDYYGSGFYDPERKIIGSISVFADGSPTAPARLSLPEPVIYVSVPSIAGQVEVRFLSETKGLDEARQEG